MLGLPGATKAALDHGTRQMATELGPHGIRINCVNPNVVWTEMSAKNWSDPVKREALINRTPLRRFTGENSSALTSFRICSRTTRSCRRCDVSTKRHVEPHDRCAVASRWRRHVRVICNAQTQQFIVIWSQALG